MRSVPITTARCTTLCDTVYQWLATGRWFSPGPPVSSTNKTDRQDITEILLKVALNTIKQTNFLLMWRISFTRFGQGDQSVIFMFYSHHYNFVNCYGIYLSEMTTAMYLSQMTTAMFHLSQMTTAMYLSQMTTAMYLSQMTTAMYLSQMTTTMFRLSQSQSYPSVSIPTCHWIWLKTGLLKQRVTLEERELLVPLQSTWYHLQYLVGFVWLSL